MWNKFILSLIIEHFVLGYQSKLWLKIFVVRKFVLGISFCFMFSRVIKLFVISLGSFYGLSRMGLLIFQSGGVNWAISLLQFLRRSEADMALGFCLFKLIYVSRRG